MRFAIETTSSRGQLAGVGHYVFRLSEAMLPLLQTNEELLAFDGIGCRPIDDAALVEQEATSNQVDSSSSGEGRPSLKYRMFLATRSVAPARFAMRSIKQWTFHAAERHFDVFHAVEAIPPGLSRKPILPLIHDLSHLRFPETHPKERVRWLTKRTQLVVNEAPFIQTVSHFSKSEIAALLRIDDKRIHVAYPGIKPAASCANDDEVLGKYDVGKRQYFLMISTREPRKNFKTVTEAYARLPGKIRASFPLVWVGRRGWGDLGLSAGAERSIAGGEIRILGYVPDRHLGSLYRNTLLFMMPSLYEGFGMPVTEALSLGAPVAISDIPVFREVAGAFARYISPLDVEGWQNAMIAAIDTPPAGNQSDALVAWLRRYSWMTNASSTLDLYRRLANKTF